jgi:hypothetical protein
MRLPRLLAACVAAGIMVLAQAVGISPARAAIGDVACNYDHVTFNACLRFRYLGGDIDFLNVHVGLDRRFSQLYAEEIVAHGAAFQAKLWAVGRSQPLADLQLLPGWPGVGGDWLGAELAADVWRGTLDVRNGEEQLYATVSFFDYHNGATETYRTGTVRGDFAPIIITPPECLVPC